MSRAFDVRRSVEPFDQNRSLVAAIELCQGSWLVVTEQRLDHPDIDAALEQWVAKEWRREWSVTGLVMPAFLTVSWKSRANCRVVSGRPGLRPGKSQRSPAATSLS